MSTSVDDKPLPVPPGIAVRAVLAMRKTLLRAADMLTPAPLAMFDKMTGAVHTMVVGEIARLGIADLLEARPLTAGEIAAATKTSPDAMMRLMRAAHALGLFKRDGMGRFSNDRLSRTLCSGEVESVRAFAEYFASRSNMHAWAAFPETVRTGQNGFEHVHGKSVWAWFEEHPHERETFAQAMMTITLFDAPGVAATYPFGEVKRLCDVGGGRGTMLSEILVRHTQLRAVLSDAAGVLDSARELLGKRGVLDRVELVPGSFFESVPAGCDAYMMKNILHDWDDERCVQILENCRRVMEKGARLLVVEQIVEEDADDYGPLSDLQMMVVCSGGRERSEADFARLFTQSGFRLRRVLAAPTPVAVLEGEAV